MHINIIGAGPIGGQTAYLLAKKGYDVHVYEDHSEVGKPVQCTGLMTISLNELLNPMKEFLVNKTKQVKIIAPNGSTLALNSTEYIVDRTLFDSYFVKKAIDAGATLHTHHRFLGLKENNILFKNTLKNVTIKTKQEILIGADGANSAVAKVLNPNRKRKYCMGIQARVRGSFDPESYTVFFDNGLSPGFFAWIVPESSSVARVGLKGTNAHFDSFLKKQGFTQIEMQAGPIPIYDPQYITEKDGIYLVGDAATQVKATTAGGLIPGLKAAQCLVDALEQEKSYECLWKRKVGRSLWLHLRLRRILDRFSNDDWNRLIGLLNKRSVKDVFERYDREKPWKLLSVIAKEPRLLQFGRYIL